MNPFGGIPLDHLDPALDILSEFSRRASLTLVLEIGYRTLSAGQPATSRDFHGYVPWLIGEGKGPRWFTFLPVGRIFSGGSRCDTVSA